MKTLAVVLLLSSFSWAGRHKASDTYSPYSAPVVTSPKPRRSPAVRAAFKEQQPCPATGKSRGPCSGYVIDHVKPLACGGADATYNLQWQTTAAGKAKDKWERKSCGK